MNSKGGITKQTDYAKRYQGQYYEKFGRARYQNNREKFIKNSRKCRIKRLYNLTLEQIDELLAKQDYKCILCSRSLKESKREIDHDHKTGKVRGILCYRCNTGLGHFNDDPIFLEKVVKYLRGESL